MVLRALFKFAAWLQGLQKQPMLLGHQLLAEQHDNGWLPLSALCTAPGTQAWFRKHAPDKLSNQEAMMDHLQPVILSHPFTETACEHVFCCSINFSFYC